MRRRQIRERWHQRRKQGDLHRSQGPPDQISAPPPIRLEGKDEEPLTRAFGVTALPHHLLEGTVTGLTATTIITSLSSLQYHRLFLFIRTTRRCGFTAWNNAKIYNSHLVYVADGMRWLYVQSSTFTLGTWTGNTTSVCCEPLGMLLLRGRRDWLHSLAETTDSFFSNFYQHQCHQS